MTTAITPSTVLQALSRHIGKANGICVTRLAEAIIRDVPDAHHERLVRRCIEELRRDGQHICAHPSTGYYIAATEEELIRTCDYLFDRAMCSLAQVAAMRNVSLPDLRGQLRLPT